MPAEFSPLPWQIAPWKDTRPIMLLCGGAGSGKSLLAAHKVIAFLSRFPKSLAIVVRKSRSFLLNSVLPSLIKLVPPGTIHRKNDSRFDFVNGSRIVYGGMNDEKQREGIRSIEGANGSGADIIWMEEANRFTEKDQEELYGRLRGTAAPWTQLILSCNPDSDKHWINQKFRMPWIAGKMRDRVSVYETKPTDNPFLKPEYLEKLQSLTGLMRARLWEARWCRADGVIYTDWDPDKHIIEPFPIPAHWTRFVSCDLGYVNPRVGLWLAKDHDENLYVYRQTYKTKQTASDHAQQIVALSAGEELGPMVCDHDAAERQDYREAGLDNVAARKDVALGLQTVEARLRATIQNNGNPKIYIFRDCLAHEPDQALIDAHKPWCLEQEFDGYIWDTGADGSKLKEQPKKENDHGLDALRYGCMHADKTRLDPAGVPAEDIQREVERASKELNFAYDADRYGGLDLGGGAGSGWL